MILRASGGLTGSLIQLLDIAPVKYHPSDPRIGNPHPPVEQSPFPASWYEDPVALPELHEKSDFQWSLLLNP